MKRNLIFLLLAAILYSCGEKQEDASKYQSAIIESRHLMDSLLATGMTPGMDIAVAIKGKTVWLEGFGFADLEHEVVIIPGETRFRIGSVSKPITAAAMGRLMDQGKMDVDREVQEYVPYFPEKKFPLTVRQVAGHIGGIRHYHNLEFMMAKHFSTVEEGIGIFRDDPLLFEPGTAFSYSSYGYNLVSAAIEGAAGKEFLSVMQKEVFDPIGMKSTCADKNDSIILHRASFYAHNDSDQVINAPYVDNSYKWAGGGFISTTSDLVKFGQAHLKPGYLSEESLMELITPQVLADGDTTSHGMGWFVGETNGRYRYGHGGGSIGGITDFVIFPEEELIIVVLSNSSDTRYGNVVGRIVELFLQADQDN